MRTEKLNLPRIFVERRMALILCAIFAMISFDVCGQLPMRLQTPDFANYGDSQYRVMYEFTLNPDNETIKKPKSSYEVLLIGPKVSMFRCYADVRGDSARFANRDRGMSFTEVEALTNGIPKSYLASPLLRFHDRSDSIQVYHQMHIGMHFRGDTLFSGQQYRAYYIDAPQVEWNISDEKKMFGPIEVTKATGRLHGRDWTVWFAESIPYFEGPWELAGLPGLILEATDDSGNFKFGAIELGQTKMPILFEDKGYKLSTREKVLKTRDENIEAQRIQIRNTKIPMPPLVTTFLDPE